LVEIALKTCQNERERERKCERKREGGISLAHYIYITTIFGSKKFDVGGGPPDFSLPPSLTQR
jgi:hypothetical protein